MSQKIITILGSTGSIGTQALDVVRENPDRYKIESLTAGKNASLLIEQIKEFKPTIAVIADESKYEEVKNAVAGLPTKVMTGTPAVAEVAANDASEMVLVALVGYSGLAPTIAAIKAHKKIALANKETLVVAGDLVCRLCEENGIKLLPVDSEHSAIFQSLVGDADSVIEKILLTASGGPFRNFTLDQMRSVTAADALKHPTWDMGAKITIDSASMMNKGFEVIEARWLFGVPAEKIQVLVHPQSIVHSAVQYIDGSVKAQLGVPDMRLPIQYAFSYPDRLKASFDRLDLFQVQNLTFEKPDTEKFRCLALAFQALHQGGNMACVVNAANEVVNKAFLEDRIAFLKMADVIEETMGKVSFIAKPTYEDYLATDAEARRVAASLF